MSLTPLQPPIAGLAGSARRVARSSAAPPVRRRAQLEVAAWAALQMRRAGRDPAAAPGRRARPPAA